MWRGGLGSEMDFATSSHRQRWLYTRTGLTEERHRLQQRVVDGLRQQRHAAAAAAAAAGDGGGGAEVAGSATKRAREPPPLAALGELLMLKYYQQIIQEKCREMRMPVKVMATAILYHKRFFLRHSSMEYDPGRLMITAIFMATKVEEYYTRAADIARSFDVTEDLVVKQEVALLEGLNFDLVVHSPYRALQGLMQELKEARAAASGASSPPGSASPPPPAALPSSLQLPPLDEGLLPAALPDSPGLDAAARASFGALDALMLSDAPLLYGPAQMAAAALRSGFKAKGVRVPNFLARVAQRAALFVGPNGGGTGTGGGGGGGGGSSASASPAPPDDPAAALTAVLDELDQLGSEGARRVEVDEVKEANAAAREWRNLLKEAGAAAAGGGGGGGGAGGGGGGEDAARAAKREAKKRERAAAKAREAELLGMPQQQQ